MQAGSRMQSRLSWRVTLRHFRSCRKECITYAYTYALDGILTRDLTRRRHAPATAPHVVILRLEGGLPIRPDCDSMMHGNDLPSFLACWGVTLT